MKRAVKRDPFFDRQPEKAFLQDLKAPVHGEKPSFFDDRAPEAGEIFVSGMYLANRWEGDQGLLDTSYDDFSCFLQVCQMAGNHYPLSLHREAGAEFESYRIVISETETKIYAGDTEGVRRALIYLEDEMLRREGPCLPLGEIRRTPAIKTRITRCFFSPINRPPKYGDELSDDVDYYPENYLNRLMHEGANGVWIYTRFSDLVPVKALPEYGRGGEKRLEKLNRVIDRCARYGIGVYVFAIEPVSLTPALSQQIPQADGGIAGNGNHYFCVNSPEGRAMIEEAGRTLFERCPRLAGFISITYGERPTSCSSAHEAIPAIGFHREIGCPRCRDLAPGQALANAATALAAGIHQASPNARVISWTYGHRFWSMEDVLESVRCTPDDVIVMQNFEEMGYAEQLGKTRQGVDYWLSYAGPSPLFEDTARQAMESGKRMFMKIQACCSHEVASVPYVPVPGLLFEKYRMARALQVEGVMQCWYFGNYPSLMGKAAGELAFLHHFSDKQAFLEQLAGIYFGRGKAAQVARAWALFEEGYTQYPLNIMFSYYGPMHDGPVWELQLLPKNFSLPRTWQTLDPVDGDRIGECLLAGHTLEEALVLTGKMKDAWDQGVRILQRALTEKQQDMEQWSVACALQILFGSGHDILRFYALREKLGLEDGDPGAILQEMKEIVSAERMRSMALSGLCQQDRRLGYHSEGEGFKFFPAKLEHRVNQLDRLLAEEFPLVEKRIRNGQPPLAYYAGEDVDSAVYGLHRGRAEDAPWQAVGDHAAFRAAYDDDDLMLEFRSDRREWMIVGMEFQLMWPAPPARLHPDGRLEILPEAYLYYAIFGDRLEEMRRIWQVTAQEGPGTHLKVILRRNLIHWQQDRPLKMRLATEGGESWCQEEDPIHTLGKSTVSPGEYGWLLPEKMR